MSGRTHSRVRRPATTTRQRPGGRQISTESTELARLDETLERPVDTLPATTVVALQASIGNQALQRVMSQDAPVQRSVVTIDGEQVEVSFFKKKQQTAEARAIIADIKSKYGVALSSPTVIEGLKDQYPDAPAKVKSALKARKWKLKELRALAKALANYAPILGAERAKSTRAGAAQEVTAVGKVEYSIDEDSPAGQLDKGTLGEYFASKKAMGLFKPAEGNKEDFPDENQQLVATFIHETAHGLLAYAYDDFVAATDGYWTDQDTASGKAGAEAPITDYGAKNAREDLCECAMFYFLAPDTLKGGRGAKAGSPGNAAPKRFAFMEKIGKDWLPPPKAAPQLTPAAAPATPAAPVPAGTH